MIYIDDTKKNILKARKEHDIIVSDYLKKKKISNKQEEEILFFILKYLNVLLRGKPDLLYRLNLKFYDSINNYTSKSYLEYLKISELHSSKRTIEQKKIVAEYKKLNDSLKKIVNYEGWFIKSSKQYDYKLATNLNVNTCTYCNRIYTNTMKTGKGKKVMRPQFDHWFPKSKFPLLALSFYNLIPSCSVCNSSAKSDTVFHLDTHLHPYIDKDMLSKYSFSFEYLRSLNTLRIKMKYGDSDIRTFETIKDLNLISMYNAHIYELEDLLLTQKTYSKKYLDGIKKAFPNARLTDEEVYRIAFGTELNEKDFSKRPFSKFKKDILRELEII